MSISKPGTALDTNIPLVLPPNLSELIAERKRRNPDPEEYLTHEAAAELVAAELGVSVEALLEEDARQRTPNHPLSPDEQKALKDLLTKTLENGKRAQIGKHVLVTVGHLDALLTTLGRSDVLKPFNVAARTAIHRGHISAPK